MSDAHQHTEPGADPGELSMVRSLLGLTQQQMAEELGISMRSIQEYEAGRNRTPPFIRQALHLITIKTALKRRNPLLMTETTGRLVDDTARMRARTLLGDKTNGWAVITGRASVNDEEADYMWAVAADDAEEALEIVSQRQPRPAGGFRIAGRLSQYTIAQLGLRVGDACPL
jgi:transcriptional regulator with XRE-family HTH domain